MEEVPLSRLLLPVVALDQLVEEHVAAVAAD